MTYTPISVRQEDQRYEPTLLLLRRFVPHHVNLTSLNALDYLSFLEASLFASSSRLPVNNAVRYSAPRCVSSVAPISLVISFPVISGIIVVMLDAGNVYGCITDLVPFVPQEEVSNRGRAIANSRLGANTQL
jgi:hypothetical protein